MFRDAESRLQMAHETIRMMREQSCVQVAVKKEVRKRRMAGSPLFPTAKDTRILRELKKKKKVK